MGAVCALTQLLLLVAFTRAGLSPFASNAVAFALAAHLNFVLGATFTWSDRRGGSLLLRWLAFIGAISGTALLNLATFEVARSVLPAVAAAAAGIGVAAACNFLLADRAVFRPARSPAFVPPAPSARLPKSSFAAPLEKTR
ncbi:MAG: GtrA family protein [Dehalococcoidia bacterium]